LDYERGDTSNLRIPPSNRLEKLKGKRRISADTALRFNSYFGNSAKFWLSLQDDFDIEELRKNNNEILHRIVQKRNNKPQPVG
jgi:plasmid maintenance system antidote protein VapI